MSRKKRGDKTDMDFRPVRPVRPMGRDGVGQSPQRRAHAPAVAASIPKPQPITSSPQKSPQPAPARKSKKERERPRLWWRIVRATFVTLAVIALFGWFVYAEVRNSSTAIDSTKYQAVFLTNGQVYFGKLEPFNDRSMKLTGIYYLQEESPADATDLENPQKTTDSQSGVQLVKLGEELHGPEDEMVILIDQLLFYENLKPDSKVAGLIEGYKQAQ